MGQDNKEEEKKEERKEEKKEENQTEIVFKVDMHCEACARKVARALKGFQGVEEVTTDSKANRVVVRGKSADPTKVYERLQKKSGRRVEIISPLPTPPEPDGGKKEANEEKKKKEEIKKEETPAVVTVVLKVQMHCEACAQVLKKRIRKMKGVDSVETDLPKNEVVVKGAVHPAMLVEYVLKRTGKQASIVVKKEKEEKEKKEEEKKEEEKKSEEAEKSDEVKKSEYWPSKHCSDYAYAYAYPPQLFSDENPNSCSVM